MAGPCEQLVHPVLGGLAWLRKYSHWFGQPTLSSGVSIDLVVDPGDGDRFEFLPRAAELFAWALEHERAIFDEANRSYLLELYNDGWREEDMPVLDHSAFSDALEWQFLRVSDSGVVPIEFGYEPGDLFGGHTVSVEVTSGMRYRGSHLIG